MSRYEFLKAVGVSMQIVFFASMAVALALLAPMTRPGAESKLDFSEPTDVIMITALVFMVFALIGVVWAKRSSEAHKLMNRPPAP